MRGKEGKKKRREQCPLLLTHEPLPLTHEQEREEGIENSTTTPSFPRGLGY